MAKEKRKLFELNATVREDSMDSDALRMLATNHPKEFYGKINEQIENGNFRWQKVRDLPKMFRNLIDIKIPVVMELMGSQRAIEASAFPLLSGNLTAAGINDAYLGVNTIGELLTEEMVDNKKVSIIAGILSEDTKVDRVDEGQDFPEVGAGEETFEIRHKRNGRMMKITAEMIEENDVANIVSRVNAVGEIAAEIIEKQTLRRVSDIDGSATSPAEPFVLRKNKVGTALYQTDNDPHDRLPSTGNRVENNTLVDETDLEKARTRLAEMKNSRGERIATPMSEMILLVPDALLTTAAKILNSELTPGVENEINMWGPRGRFRPTLISSPKLDDLSTDVWYLGAFKRQFKRKWKLRLENVSLFGDTQAFLQSRIAAQFRIAWDHEIGAQDYVYVVQNLTGTTAP